jgi:hypothetical protein
MGVEQRSITTYRPGPDDANTTALDSTLPVETHVEREAVLLQMRGSVQSGQYFETLIRQEGIAGPDAVIAAFRQAFPIAPNLLTQRTPIMIACGFAPSLPAA